MLSTITPAIASPVSLATAHRLESLTVSGGFLDGLDVRFAQGLNCFIGARGTGKTTVLELIRYVMDAMPGDPVARRKIEDLVAHNLAGGQVTVHLRTKDGLAYAIRRTPGEEAIVLDERGEPTPLAVRSGGLFRIDVFSQNQIEAIADTPPAQLELIDSFALDAVQALDRAIHQAVSDLEANGRAILPLTEKVSAVADEVLQLPGVEEKLRTYAGEGGADSAELEREHRLKALRDREGRALAAAPKAMAEQAEVIKAEIGGLLRRMGNAIRSEMSDGPNGRIFADLQRSLCRCGETVDQRIEMALESLQGAWREVHELQNRLDLAHKAQELRFGELLAQHKEAQGKAGERSRLERMRNDLLGKQLCVEELRDRIAKLREDRRTLLDQLSQLRDQRFALRAQVAAGITQRLGNTIRVNVTQHGDTEGYRSFLESRLRSGGMQHKVVATRLGCSIAPLDLAQAVERCDTAALIERAGINGNQAERVVEQLGEPVVLSALQVIALGDQPSIELNDGGTWKPTHKLSTGQKCTAVLPILLVERESPLLVDQPEDNLDNSFVFQAIVNGIRAVKQTRQLVFVTHNPNIPVLGEADQVFVLESDGRRAGLKASGGVDACKADIVNLLEGGERAFIERKTRYQY